MSTKRLLMSCSNHFKMPSDAVEGIESDWIIYENRSTSEYVTVVGYKGPNTKIVIPYYINNRYVRIDADGTSFLNTKVSGSTGNNVTSVGISNYVTGYSNQVENSFSYMFCYSKKLKTFTGNIPDSITSMSSTFSSCSKLTGNIPNIPNSVTNMCNTFRDCSKFAGTTTYIHSTNITNAMNCFYRTSSKSSKNIYIHYTYDNGAYTATYNSFQSAGYVGTNTTEADKWNVNVLNF